MPTYDETIAAAVAKRRGDWDTLVKMLDPDRSGGYNLTVLEALGDVGDRRALPHLFAYLELDRRPGIQFYGWRALGGFDDPAVWDALEGLVADRREPGRYGAVEALGRLGGDRAVSILALALDDNRGVRMKAASALARTRSDAAVQVLERMTGDEHDLVRRRAVEMLLWIGTRPAFHALHRALPQVRPAWRRWSLARRLRGCKHVEIARRREANPPAL